MHMSSTVSHLLSLSLSLSLSFSLADTLKDAVSLALTLTHSHSFCQICRKVHFPVLDFDFLSWLKTQKERKTERTM